MVARWVLGGTFVLLLGVLLLHPLETYGTKTHGVPRDEREFALRSTHFVDSLREILQRAESEVQPHVKALGSDVNDLHSAAEQLTRVSSDDLRVLWNKLLQAHQLTEVDVDHGLAEFIETGFQRYESTAKLVASRAQRWKSVHDTLEKEMTTFDIAKCLHPFEQHLQELQKSLVDEEQSGTDTALKKKVDAQIDAEESNEKKGDLPTKEVEKEKEKEEKEDTSNKEKEHQDTQDTKKFKEATDPPYPDDLSAGPDPASTHQKDPVTSSPESSTAAVADKEAAEDADDDKNTSVDATPAAPEKQDTMSATIDNNKKRMTELEEKLKDIDMKRMDMRKQEDDLDIEYHARRKALEAKYEQRAEQEEAEQEKRNAKRRAREDANEKAIQEELHRKMLLGLKQEEAYRNQEDTALELDREDQKLSTRAQKLQEVAAAQVPTQPSNPQIPPATKLQEDEAKLAKVRSRLAALEKEKEKEKEANTKAHAEVAPRSALPHYNDFLSDTTVAKLLPHFAASHASSLSLLSLGSSLTRDESDRLFREKVATPIHSFNDEYLKCIKDAPATREIVSVEEEEDKSGWKNAEQLSTDEFLHSLDAALREKSPNSPAGLNEEVRTFWGRVFAQANERVKRCSDAEEHTHADVNALRHALLSVHSIIDVFLSEGAKTIGEGIMAIDPTQDPEAQVVEEMTEVNDPNDAPTATTAKAELEMQPKRSHPIDEEVYGLIDIEKGLKKMEDSEKVNPDEVDPGPEKDPEVVESSKNEEEEKDSGGGGGGGEEEEDAKEERLRSDIVEGLAIIAAGGV